MKEEDIRPDSPMHENAKLRAEDIRKILKRKDEFVEISCPACEDWYSRKMALPSFAASNVKPFLSIQDQPMKC